MRIIAQTEEQNHTRHYLVDASVEEIKQIVGDRLSDKKITIGAEIKVSNIYVKYRSMTSNKAKLKAIRDQANLILESIAKIEPIVAPHAETKD